MRLDKITLLSLLTITSAIGKSMTPHWKILEQNTREEKDMATLLSHSAVLTTILDSLPNEDLPRYFPSLIMNSHLFTNLILIILSHTSQAEDLAKRIQSSPLIHNGGYGDQQNGTMQMSY